MFVSSKQNQKNYSKLAAISVILAFGFFGLAEKSQASLVVDFTNITIHPLLKSKIGFARSFTAEFLPESIGAMQQIKPAMLCSQVDFDSLTATGGLNANYAMRSNPILSDGTVAAPTGSDWLLKLENNLEAQHMKIMLSLTGQPFIQYTREERENIGVHPTPATPADITASATAMANWAAAYYAVRSDFPVHWSVWTEPGHTLTGTGTLQAAEDIMNIYLAYFQKLNPESKYDTFSLASFIAADIIPTWDEEAFLSKVFGKYTQKKTANPDLQLDYVTFNNYYGSTSELLATSRQQIASNSPSLTKTPYVLTQYAPWNVTKDINGILVLSPIQKAVEEIGGLHDLLEEADVEHVCFAWWLREFLNWNGISTLPSSDSDPIFTPSYQALKLYTQMPTWRAAQSGTLPTGVEAMSSVDENTAAVLLWYDGATPINVPLTFNLPWTPAKITRYQLNDANVIPLPETLGSVPSSVDFSAPGIILLKFDKTNTTVAENSYLGESKLVRTFSFADRQGASGNFAPTGSYGNYDAQRSTAYVGATPAGYGIAGVRYYDLPDNLSVEASLANNQTIAGQNATIGLRVDYLDAQGAPAKTMFFGHNGTASTAAFPWGSLLPNYQAAKPDNYKSTDFPTDYVLQLAQNAPVGWSADGRDAILSFVVENSGSEVQAKFQLGDVVPPTAPSGLSVM